MYYNEHKSLYHHVRKGDYPSEFEVPKTVTYIGNHAFANCSGLTKIGIPNSVKTIGRYAFANCSNLTEIIIPDTVESIGEGAFEKCTNLKKSDFLSH